MSKLLIIGDGLLGTEIRKQTGWDYISRKKDGIDFVNFNSYQQYLNDYSQILNCVAYTNTYSNERQKHWDTNFRAVIELVDYCTSYGKKLIHISTDYVYSSSRANAAEDDVPVHCRNWYGYTKLLGDGYVQAKARKYLLIRTSYKPRPFPYPNAITTQVGNFDYVDTISKMIIEIINNDAVGIFNVGTDEKTIYDLARKSIDVVPINELLHETMPTNTTMKLNKLQRILK